MTEVGMALGNPYKCGPRVPGQVGAPFPFVNVKVNEENELFIAGPQVAKGYWNRPAETAENFFTDENGFRWFKTGDVVDVTEDGNYIIRGRASVDIIKVIIIF